MSKGDIIELLVQRIDTGETLRLMGREAWTLAWLIEAGPRGIAPIERPAPRVSAYVHSLRKRGLVIETLDERHAGPFPGSRGRYVLRTSATALKAVSADERHRAA
jgi:hypothetical protein